MENKAEYELQAHNLMGHYQSNWTSIPLQQLHMLIFSMSCHTEAVIHEKLWPSTEWIKRNIILISHTFLYIFLLIIYNIYIFENLWFSLV